MKFKKADWKETTTIKQVGVSDMTLLSKITNEAINENLKNRFLSDNIYTYIGHVLISVNPFKDTRLYTDEILKSYIGRNRLELPPHVFAISEMAYRNMIAYKENQCVIISGESGAGKTEAAKKIMHYIASVSGENSSSIKEIKDMVLATNPLLESFGCAKTLRNNNSSRHGKYLELQFNSDGEPVGAVITNYLLEKGRVVSQIKNERNFHIFYQFCKGASDLYREQFGILQPENYWYLHQSGCLDVDNMDDIEEYRQALSAMNVIGLSEYEQFEIHRLLSSILLLGNIQFDENDSSESFIVDQSVAEFTAHILQVDKGILTRALTSRIIETRRGIRKGSTYQVPLNPVQATAVRDALSKAIYDRLFEWIVSRVNNALKQRGQYDFTIGVLDIYGFEIFDHNSFEQLCINYVNEKLQQIFIELTLKAEQDEYVREKIQWNPIKFFNNKIVCDLIEEKRPPGIFAALNDAVATAHADSKAADGSFIQRASGCSSNPHFSLRGQSFVIKHYAGDVTYEVNGMTDKNKDSLFRDLLELVQSSDNKFLLNLFPEQTNKDSKKRPPTASDRIKKSAASLVSTLMGAQPSYIRCIKPNENKKPREYDNNRVGHQVKYLGLCENIRVRRAGFAYRQTFEKFVERFFLLSSRTSYAGDFTWKGSAKQAAKCIFEDTSVEKDEWQLGETKAFIRHPETLWSLESLRNRYWHNMAARIQRAWRAYVRRKHECAIIIQRAWRKNKDQIRHMQLRDYGHTILAQRKERRRFSLLSMRRFYGDYLGVTFKENSGELISSVCQLKDSELVLFSHQIDLLLPRPLRSSKLFPRILVLTEKTLYILVTSLEKKLPTLKLEKKIPVRNIKSISLSNLQDDWMFIHLRNPNDIDLILVTPFKTELGVHLACILEGSLDLNISSTISYTKKPGKTGTIKFVKDESASRYSSYKNHTVSICSGSPPDSSSDPPCPRIGKSKKLPKKVRPI